TRVRALLEDLEADLIGSDLPVATRDSPLAPTPFGEACVLTGLSPDSCRTLVRSLDALRGRLWSSQSELLADVLDSAHVLAEALISPLAPIYKARSRYPVKQDEFAQVIGAWLSGRSLENIFVGLRYLAGSRRAPPVSAWSAGLLTPSTWE